MFSKFYRTLHICKFLVLVFIKFTFSEKCVLSTRM